ncbi:MAG: FAD-dependent oxidoreductase [Rhodocyclaceae bacterium]|nr:FAD-dependent oxidoreductase [Rhodocyclaceae bacterium]
MTTMLCPPARRAATPATPPPLHPHAHVPPPLAHAVHRTAADSPQGAPGRHRPDDGHGVSPAIDPAGAVAECRAASHVDGCRIAVLGAGVIGLATALALRQRGHTVGVFESQAAGHGSSWAGAGILYPLLPWDYDATVNHWCARGMALQPTWLAGLRQAVGIDPEYRVTGMRVVDGWTTAAAAWLRRHGHAHRRDGADLVLPEVAQVRNPRLIDALLGACRTAGVALHQNLGPVHPLVAVQRARGVRWAAGEWHADAVVLCAGAWSGVLEGLAALPVYPVRGQMLALRAPELPAEIVYEDGRYLVPRRDGVVLLGATLEHAGFDAATTRRAAASLLAWAQRQHPALTAERVIRHWSGLRPGSRRNHPLVGAHPEIEGLWLNTGHFRYGLTMAPACAEALATQITAMG